jgi:hypothetical protein
MGTDEGGEGGGRVVGIAELCPPPWEALRRALRALGRSDGLAVAASAGQPRAARGETEPRSHAPCLPDASPQQAGPLCRPLTKPPASAGHGPGQDPGPPHWRAGRAAGPAGAGRSGGRRVDPGPSGDGVGGGASRDSVCWVRRDGRNGGRRGLGPMQRAAA